MIGQGNFGYFLLKINYNWTQWNRRSQISSFLYLSHKSTISKSRSFILRQKISSYNLFDWNLMIDHASRLYKLSIELLISWFDYVYLWAWTAETFELRELFLSKSIIKYVFPVGRRCVSLSMREPFFFLEFSIFCRRGSRMGNLRVGNSW